MALFSWQRNNKNTNKCACAVISDGADRDSEAHSRLQVRMHQHVSIWVNGKDVSVRSQLHIERKKKRACDNVFFLYLWRDRRLALKISFSVANALYLDNK